ncbi:MAG: peroxidase family protein [Bryobacterales bacterium]|nr:peroxidase family protein [Bryobacterales bacterium]
MPHISLPEGLPGISSGFAFRPETAKPMRDLAHVLLHENNTLCPAERELIATYVSTQNDCYFCHASHGAAATAHLGENAGTVDQVKHDFLQADIPGKLKALLVIAGQVQQGGKYVSPTSVEEARRLGATDLEIHDTVLIAAAFCMYNRYVDGLATWQPHDPGMYADMGKHLAEHGYTTPSGKS